MTIESNVVPAITSTVAGGQSIMKDQATTAIPLSYTERLEKFNGQNFKRWQQKMFFHLTMLNFTRFLTKNGPKPKEGEIDVQVISVINA